MAYQQNMNDKIIIYHLIQLRTIFGWPDIGNKSITIWQLQFNIEITNNVNIKWN